MSIVLPPTQQRTNLARRGVAISPTGTHVVYVANNQLYLRPLDELEAQPLLGTEGSDPTGPFFSPDGQWIGFFTNRDYALKKVALAGGAAVTLAQTPGAASASWGADDTIVFGVGDILRVAGAGGTPEVLVRYQTAGAIAVFPQMLPGGEAVLYTRTSVSSCAPGFPWTLDCERVLAGGVSKWGSQIKVRRRRREPGGRPEMLPGTAVGDGFRPGASARRCCVLLRGEDLESVSRELGITAARASQWRDQFLAAGPGQPEEPGAGRPGRGQSSAASQDR